MGRQNIIIYGGSSQLPPTNFIHLMIAIDISESDLKGSINIQQYCKQHNIDPNTVEEIECNINEITELTIINFPNLKYVNCGENEITTLNIKNCLKLTSLCCDWNKLTTLDCSHIPSLEYLSINQNPMTSLIVFKCIYLDTISIVGAFYTQSKLEDCIKVPEVGRWTVLDGWLINRQKILNKGNSNNICEIV